MSASNSDDYQVRFNYYERALENAKGDIQDEIDSFDGSEEEVKKELKLILPEIINENFFRGSDIPLDVFEDMKSRMSDELNGYINTITIKKEITKKEPIKKEITKKEPIKKEPIKKEPIKKEPIKKEITIKKKTKPKRTKKKNLRRKILRKKTLVKRTKEGKQWISPIPQKVHLIWIGGDRPDYFELFLQTFRDNLPGFEIKVWGNKDLTKKNFPKTYSYIQKAKKLQGKPMKDEENNTMLDDNYEPYKYSKWAQITDLMRLEIVYNHGGYYFDTTFEILKPMYKLLNKKTYTFVGCNEIPRFNNVHILSNSFFGATEKNPILKRLLLKSSLDEINFHDHAVDFQTGPGYLRSGIKSDDNYFIFPTTHFYPFVEEYSPGVDPPYRKSSKNKCHDTKKKKKTMKVIKNKGYLDFPCKKYPKSYALKHSQLGKSWLINDYNIRSEDKVSLKTVDHSWMSD